VSGIWKDALRMDDACSTTLSRRNTSNCRRAVILRFSKEIILLKSLILFKNLFGYVSWLQVRISADTVF
jgi:hypothetical protein